MTTKKKREPYTPGPWSVEDGELSHQGAALGQVYTADDFPCVDESEREAMRAEYEGNARLIAAAPDLYHALRIVLEDVATHPSGKLCLPCVTVEVVRDALARVAGVPSSASVSQETV